MGKRIWIINYYTCTPGVVSNPRYIKIAEYLKKRGYEVITFNSSKAERLELDRFGKNSFLKRSVEGLDYVHVRVPDYKGNGLKRMYSIWVFARKMLKIGKYFPKPDIILHNIHPPFDYPVINLAKKTGAKYIAEAWDLWPEDFVTFGLVKPNNLALKLAYAVEKKFYYKADEIVFTFLGAFDYLKRQRWMKEQGGKVDPNHLHYINNGIDLEQFNKDKMAYPRPDEDMNDSSIIKIVYLGSINKANNVQTLIDAAALMRNKTHYKFFIYGNGAYRNELIKYVKENEINNVVFKEEKITFAECAWVVSQATVNVMNYEKGFGRFGVSSGKMFQYLAAGKPIVCNIDIDYDNVIKDNNLGFAYDIESPEDFATLIQKLAEQSKEEYEAMCERVREVAKRFDYKVLCAEELKVIES